MTSPPTIILSGTASSVGKTTVTMGLIAALRRRGLVVQPFKVGPDFIDPGHLSAASLRQCRNLDTWMLSEETVRHTFHSASAGADIAVIEGVMGLFDGRSGADLEGSTADLARLLQVPVVLVVDAHAMAGSIAPLVKGFAEFHPDVKVAGVICNRVAGPRHYEILRSALMNCPKVKPLGWLPYQEEIAIPERHLGLTTVADLKDSIVEHLGMLLAQTVDVDQSIEIGRSACKEYHPSESVPSGYERLPRSNRQATVAVAQDAAFCFYYQDNLEYLELSGAKVATFSPLKDESLPPEVDLLYLGGGYPELHAGVLAANRAMADSIRRYVAGGGRIYAECGGLMYACRELVDGLGHVYPMLDLIPARTLMQQRRSALGYVTMRTTQACLLGPTGTTALGHEFHYSTLEALDHLTFAATLETSCGECRPDGIIAGNLYAGYAHLHFGSNPAVAAALLGQMD